MIRSGHEDSFARDNLPPQEQWPQLLFTLPELNYPDRLNCVSELVDKWVADGQGDRIALVSPQETLTYAELSERINRIANVLTRDLGMVSGNRVLLRSFNNPTLIAAYLAVIKAGGIAVATMPLLRSGELAYQIEKVKIGLALCDSSIAEELEKASALASSLKRIVSWGGSGVDRLEALMQKPGYENFTACDTAIDDVCLIAFTSGTTGEPKGTIQFHRDMLLPCDTYARYVLRASIDDRFIGSAPLAFTFGLGGHLLFPFRIGATSILIEKTSPDELLAALSTYKASICFTAPTAYRAMLPRLSEHDISALRTCVSAGETLPADTYEAWLEATGLKIIDGLGSTEMMHIFISSPEEESRPGATGKPVPGYIAKIVDENGNDAPRGMIGRLAVRGPTGCRYFSDKRQIQYVQNGWNLTGDAYWQDEDGYFHYHARSDDMIVSAGYNIAGPEIEDVLLTHPAVSECGVVGSPDRARGQIVKAYIVLRDGYAGDDMLTKALQDYVKGMVAPYKYPRAIEYVKSLPQTHNGKLHRLTLRQMAAKAQQ